MCFCPSDHWPVSVCEQVCLRARPSIVGLCQFLGLSVRPFVNRFFVSTLVGVFIISFSLDTKVPQVRLIGTPPKRSRYDTGTFYWLSDERANYECAINLAESGTSCGSGMRRNWISPRLDDGKHVFYLFATDDNGNQANPVEYRWEIGEYPFFAPLQL